MKPRRRIRALALAFAILALPALAGCGGSDRAATETTASPAEDVQITTAFGPMDKLPGVLRTAPPWPANREQLEPRLRAIGLPALTAEGRVVDIRQHLDLLVEAKQVRIPANIGIGEGLMAPLHTHDEVPSVIHVTSPTETSFSLGQFFAVWGVRLDARCIGSRCAGGGTELRTWVDGKRFGGDPTSLVLEDSQQIVIAYGTPAQMPEDVPATYDFEAAGS
ncbi:MAG: hypothetical protein ACR2LK_05920 [Solirubrobacteraceae bacterium]